MVGPTQSPPACPACRTPAHVFRAGLIERRKRRGPVQNWKCGRCKRRFLDPAAPRIRPGRQPDFRLKERVLALRKTGMTFQRIGETLHMSKARARVIATYTTNSEVVVEQRVAVRFEVFVKPSLLESLRQMYQAANGGTMGANVQSVSAFASELLECAIIDFRAKQNAIRDFLPLSPLASESPAAGLPPAAF
jgi:transposase-like protein